MSRKDLRTLAVLVLVAAVAGLSSYVLRDLLQPDSTALATPTPAETATPTASHTPTLPPTPTPTSPPPTSTPQPSLQEIGQQAARALVFVVVEGPDGYAGGSGSIVDGEQGLILTNWHVVTDDAGNLSNEEGYAGIAMTEDLDRAPVGRYWAQVLTDCSDAEKDLALLRVTHRISDSAEVELPLSLPAISLGDSDDVGRGDTVVLLGYPDYGEGTVSWTTGSVATITEEWIKSDAEASYGHSGGMMLNECGELIGVISGGESVGLQAQLTLARPINVAADLIRRAAAGLWPLSPAAPESSEPSGEPMVVMGTTVLSLRVEPDLNRRWLTEIPRGTLVDIRGSPTWDGERFWVQGGLMDNPTLAAGSDESGPVWGQ